MTLEFQSLSSSLQSRLAMLASPVSPFPHIQAPFIEAFLCTTQLVHYTFV